VIGDSHVLYLPFCWGEGNDNRSGKKFGAGISPAPL
jgi:hypothetical protein